MVTVTPKVEYAALKLFRALPVQDHDCSEVNDDLIRQTLRYGFVVTPDVMVAYSHIRLDKLIHSVLGLTPEELNSSFHKSWAKVCNADLEQLLVEQLAHYMTTYGKADPMGYLAEKEGQWGVESLAAKIGSLADVNKERVYDADYMYVPDEVLNIPELRKAKIKIVIIRGLTREELKDKLMNLLKSGVALAEDTLSSVLDLAMWCSVTDTDLQSIRNREIRAMLYKHLDRIPEDPVEFLRYLVYRVTDKTLLIKNVELIDALRAMEGDTDREVYRMLALYDHLYGYSRLAEVFYRFKPIFLALRGAPDMNAEINRIRKLAVKYHKPMPIDFLNTVTAQISRTGKIDRDRLWTELQKVNPFRKVRLAYALDYRSRCPENILYKVRNGKSYATELERSGDPETCAAALNTVLDSIVLGLMQNVSGRRIYVPGYIRYSLPATEKQFTGNLPSGTCVELPENMMVGIHWDNVEGYRIDLDLSLLMQTGKCGWNGVYRNSTSTVLFSGDLTSAPPPYGATELLYVRKSRDSNIGLVYVNYYNFARSETEVPMRILIARSDEKQFGRSYTVDPNCVLATAETRISRKEKLLGLLKMSPNGSQFYFCETYLGNSISSSMRSYTVRALNYLTDMYSNPLDLNRLLMRAGATMVTDPEDADINLSPEKLTRTSILDLLKCEQQKC